MRLVTYRHERHGAGAQVGVVLGDSVLRASALLEEPEQIAMVELLGRGPEGLARLREAAEQFAAERVGALRVPPELAVPIWACALLAPVPRPGSLRDFYGFEQHVATAYRARGRAVPRAWYEVPVFFFVHAGSMYGPDEAVRRPEATRELDFELEVACVIGQGGRDIPAERAWEHVAGLTILNDWSARDVQRQEMSVGLGPAKAKDFASSLGPYLVTLDELADRFEDDRHDLWMVARVDGEEVSRGNLKELYWSFPRMIARASAGVDLEPGDVIGSGTVGSGCILELGPEVVPWLEPGNEVELEVERLGRLRTMIV
jgi:2-keto-4-pentenoate hydratase/2-oxohepta-3-ene-1,7-dioic acid hydratase in catechol pathway